MALNLKKSTATKRSWPRRILRVALWTMAAIFILLILVILGLTLYLTPQRIESIAEQQAGSILRQDLTFTNAHFNIFNGFVFENIVLSPPDSAAQPLLPVHSASAKQVALRYSLRKILKRQVIISSAVIDSPQVYVVMEPVESPPQQPQEEPVFQESTETESEASAPQHETTTLPHSFIALELDNFRLKNAGFTVDMIDSVQQQHLYLSDLSISLDDVSAPRGDLLAQDSLIQANFQMRCRKAQVQFEQKAPEQNIRFAGELDAKLDVIVDGLSFINIDGFGELNKIFVDVNDQFNMSPNEFSSPLRAEFRGFVNAKSGTAKFEPISFTVDEQPWVSMRVSADSLLTMPYIDLKIEQSRIPVQQLVTMAQPFVPAEVMPAIYLHNSASHLSLTGTHVSGHLPDDEGHSLSCYVSLIMDDFGATLNRGEHFLKNFDIKTEFSALVGLSTVENPAATVTARYDSVFITTADGQKVYSGHAVAGAEARLNSAFFPTLVTGHLSMSNLLGSEIQGNMSVTSNGGLGSIRGDGDFNLNNIDISPFTKKQVLTRVSVDADFNINTFDDIFAQAVVFTDSITLVQNSDKTFFSPIFVNAVFKGAADTLFQKFAIRSLRTELNNFAAAELTGTGSLSSGTRVDVNHIFASVDIDTALAWLPPKLTAPIADVRVTGQATLNSQAHLRITETDTVYHGGLLLKTSNVNIDYQNGITRVTGIEVDVNGNIHSSDTTNLAINIDLTNVESNQLPDKVFRDNKIRFKFSAPNFSTVHVDTGFIHVPDLKTTGKIDGQVQLVNNAPIIDAKIVFTQNAADTISVLPDMFYIGQNDIELDVQADSTIGKITARIRTTDLSVSLPQDIRVDKINANISLAQEIDLKNGALIISPGAVVHTPTDGLIDYRLYRDYYFQPDKNPSSINIRRAIVGDYRVENIHADAYIGAGAVEVPYFAVDVYGGNIGGSFSLLSDIDDLMQSTFKLSAHISDINSGLLLPTLDGSTQGLIKAHTEISGSGLDPNRGIELNGFFNITQIEAKVASNLLTLLDPEGKDRAIGFTKLVMRYGYKPRLMTFDLEHGFCYPAILITQPWYNPIRLSGGSIEFARIPVASLFEMNQ